MTLPHKALKLTSDEEQALALRVREELARRRMTREALAERAKISISTLEKVLSGRRPFTLQTIVRVEEALGVQLLSPGLRGGHGFSAAAEPAHGHAPEHLGSYTRAAVTWLEGSYLTLRPSFKDERAVFAYRTDIFWSEETQQLQFREAERLDHDYTQFGSVSVPHQSGHIYLVTNRHGQVRLVVAGRPTIRGEMHGLLTTLRSDRGAHLSPVSLPIAFQKIKSEAAPKFGVITEGQAEYARYRALIRSTLEDGFASFRMAG